jgi:hypothetical protein
MSPEPSEHLQQWIVSYFNEQQTNPDFLPAYQRFILGEIEEYWETEKLDFAANMDSLADPDDPEIGTYAECMAARGEEFLPYFSESVKEGHTYAYAEAYARELFLNGDEFRASAAAYKAIGANAQEWTADNPGYQDVLHACRTQGKDDDFAHRCAKGLPDREFFFKRAFEASVEYDQNIAKALSKGRSATFATAYAEAWNIFAEVEEVALNYAECFEKLLGAGRSSDEADYIAHDYATKYIEGYVDDDDGDPDFEDDKDDALAQAESAYRFRGLPAEDKKLPEIFLRICQRKYPTEHSKQWFDEIETLARSVLTGEKQVGDIPRSQYVQSCVEDAQLSELEKPPRFSQMSEEDFKNFHAKSEGHYDLWEDEARFREDCRENGFDPTDSDERARYKEILDETRDDNY